MHQHNTFAIGEAVRKLYTTPDPCSYCQEIIRRWFSTPIKLHC